MVVNLTPCCEKAYRRVFVALFYKKSILCSMEVTSAIESEEERCG